MGGGGNGWWMAEIGSVPLNLLTEGCGPCRTFHRGRGDAQYMLALKAVMDSQKWGLQNNFFPTHQLRAPSSQGTIWRSVQKFFMFFTNF